MKRQIGTAVSRTADSLGKDFSFPTFVVGSNAFAFSDEPSNSAISSWVVFSSVKRRDAGIPQHALSGRRANQIYLLFSPRTVNQHYMVLSI